VALRHFGHVAVLGVDYSDVRRSGVEEDSRDGPVWHVRDRSLQSRRVDLVGERGLLRGWLFRGSLFESTGLEMRPGY